MEDDTSEKVWPQYLLAFICNFGSLAFGLHIGWLSPIQRSLESEETPLAPHIPPLTIEQISWIGALPTIAFLLAPLPYGYSLQKLGRKFTALLTAIPSLISFTSLIFARNVETLYVARVFSGLSACIFIVIPIYVNECVEDKIRGRLSGLTGIFLNVGIFLAYVFGGFTDYLTLNVVGLLFPIGFLIFYLWLPESPQYLVTKDKRELAVIAIHRLRGGTREKNEAEVEKIFQVVKRSKNLNEKSKASSVLKDPAFIKGVAIIMGIFSVQQLSGITAIVGYNTEIFTEAGTSIDPIIASIVMSSMQILGSIIGTSLVDRYGRKKLLLGSCLSVLVSLICFTSYLYRASEETKASLGWIPVVALSTYILSYASGFGTIAYVLLPELFPPQARPLASSICTTWISILAFTIVKFFPFLSETLGLAGAFTIFTCFVSFGFLFIFFVVFETKNKTTAEILRILGGNKEIIDEIVETEPIVVENNTITLVPKNGLIQ